MKRILFRCRGNPAGHTATRTREQSGFASVLAMLYLVLFSTLAVGFVVSTNVSVQVAKNDRSFSEAQLAGENGLRFMSMTLGNITVPGGTPQAGLLDAVATQLGLQLNNTPNMGTNTVQNSSGVVYIPSASGWVSAGTAGSGFRATITQNGLNLVLNVTGRAAARSGSATTSQKILQLQFQQAQKAGAIFNFGIASKGELSMSNSVVVTGSPDPTKGSILIGTAGGTPISNSANATSISGDLSYTNASGTPSYGKMTVAGYSSSAPQFAQHVHAGVTPPTWPTIDTSAFLPYCTNTYPNTSGGVSQTLTNTVLAPGNYNFSNTTSIQGILYIRTPAKVSFSGPVNLQGCIVVENNPQGTSATNLLKFSNTVTATPISSLPANSTFPSGERALTGSVILAPNFSVVATNTFGTVSGSMVAGDFSFTNAFTATVYGSIVQLDDVPMSFTNTANITVESTGTSAFPAGVTFGTKYTPLMDTYLELVQ